MLDPRWLNDEVQGLPCRVLLPESYQPSNRYPLVLSLHGSGERGDDNQAQLKNGLDTFLGRDFRDRFPCIVVAPQAARGESFGGSWYGGRTALQDRIVALLHDLAGRRTVDADRMYGVGFSMGAIGLLDLAARHPTLLAAIVPIAGDLDPASIDGLRRVPLWAFVGARDDVVPPGALSAAATQLQNSGCPCHLTVVADAGHDVWRAAFSHAPLWPWMFAQRRGCETR